MPPRRPLFSTIARSIRGRMSKTVEDNPDGALAKYLWLWQSMGRPPGGRLVPRPIRFFFVVSLDVLSLVGWYVRTGILRVARNLGSKEAIMRIYRTNQVAALAIVAGMAIGGGLTFGFLESRSDDVVFVPDPVVAPSVTMTPDAPHEALFRARQLARKGVAAEIESLQKEQQQLLVVAETYLHLSDIRQLRGEALQRAQDLARTALHFSDRRQVRSEALQRVQEALELWEGLGPRYR